MTLFVAQTLPREAFYEVIRKLEAKRSLNTFLSGNVDGHIHDIDVSGSYKENPYLVLDCSTESACEFLKWVRGQSEDSISSVGVKYDSGWEIGAITLTNKRFWLFKTSDIGVYGEYSMRQWAERNGLEFDPTDVLHNEVRDEVQHAFIDYLDQNGSPEGLEKAEVFSVFVKLGIEYSVEALRKLM